MTTLDRALWRPVDACGPAARLVGDEREGHGSIGLLVAPPPAAPCQQHGAAAGDQQAVAVVVMLGGVVDGEPSADILVGIVRDAAVVEWHVGADAQEELGHREAFGIVQHPHCASDAIVIGGMSSDLDALDDVWRLSVVISRNVDATATDGAGSTIRSNLVTVDARKIDVTGEGPGPRAKLCCAAAEGTSLVFAFGGEDADGMPHNDLFCLDVQSWVWQPVDVGGGPRPDPRVLSCAGAWLHRPASASADATMPQRRSVSVLVSGGCHFDSGRSVSFGDAWAARIESNETPEARPGNLRGSWSRLGSAWLAPGPVNGGYCAVRADDSAVTIIRAGGKEGATGSDAVSVVTVSNRSSSWDADGSRPEPAARLLLPPDADKYGADVDGMSAAQGLFPHWRYLCSGAHWPARRVPRPTEREAGAASGELIMLTCGNCRHPDRVACYSLWI